MANPVTTVMKVLFSAVDGVSGVASKAKDGIGSFGDKVASVGKMLGAVFVTGALAQFFRTAVQEADEGRKGMERLGNAVTRAGGDFDRLSPSLERSIAKVQQFSTATDDELRGALTNMVTITGDVVGSQNALQLAADLAAKKQIGLEEASTLVGKAMQGNTKGLKDLGINTTDASEAIAQLQQKVGGFAKIEAESFVGGLKRAWNQLGEFQEAVGNVILGQERLGGVSNWAADTLGGLAKYVEANEERFKLFLSVVGEAAGQLIGAGKVIWDVAGPAVTWLSKVALGGLIAGLTTVSTGVRLFADLWKYQWGRVATELADIIGAATGLLQKFGITIGQDMVASLASWGARMKRTAKEDAGDAMAAYLASMAKFQDATQMQAKKAEADSAQHETNKTEIARAGSAVRAEEDEKALKASERAAQKRRDHERKFWEDALKSLEQANRETSKKMQERDRQLEANAELLRSIIAGKLGDATAQALGLTTAAMDRLLVSLRGKIPSDEWERLNQAAREHKTDLADLLPPASELAESANEAREAKEKYAKALKESKKDFGELVNTSASLARAFLDAGQAVGVIDDKMASILNASISLAANISKAFGGDPTAIAASVTSLANIIVGIGSSETERRRASAAAANTQALDRLTREVGNLNLRESGKTFTGVQTAVDAAVSARAEARARGQGPGDADKAAYEAFVASLREQGIGLGEARELFKELFGRDLAMANKGTFFQDILAFQQGLGAAEFGQYGQDVSGQLRAVQDQIELLNVTDDDAKLALYRKALGGRSSLIDSVLNAEDPAAALARLQEIAVGLNSGAFKGREAEFGDFSGTQLLDLLKILKPLLEGSDLLGGALPAALGFSAGGSPATASMQWGGGVTGAAILGDVLGTPILSPRFPDAFLTGGEVATGNTILHGDVIIHQHFPDVTDPLAAAEQSASAIAQVLGSRLSGQRMAMGLNQSAA